MVSAIESNAVSNALDVWSNGFDISLLARWYSFDIISEVTFGESLDLLKAEEFRWLPLCLERTSVFIYLICFDSHVRFWRWFLGSRLPGWLGMRDAVEAQRYNAFATDLFERRKARMQRNSKASGDGGDDDLMAHLLQSNSLSDGDLQADSSLLVAAGSDAVRLTISAAIF